MPDSKPDYSEKPLSVRDIQAVAAALDLSRQRLLKDIDMFQGVFIAKNIEKLGTDLWRSLEDVKIDMAEVEVLNCQTLEMLNDKSNLLGALSSRACSLVVRTIKCLDALDVPLAEDVSRWIGPRLVTDE